LRSARWSRALVAADSLETLGRHRGFRDLYEVSDALGIAAFTVTGVAVAISARLDPLWLWAPLLAMLTAAGGGMLRDLVQQAGKLASLHREFYAEVRGRRLPRARRHR